LYTALRAVSPNFEEASRESTRSGVFPSGAASPRFRLRSTYGARAPSGMLNFVPGMRDITNSKVLPVDSYVYLFDHE